MKTKKLLSVVLIALMLLSCIPIFASAAEPIQLTEANVTVWPTANGSIYYGQRISDGITLSGGEVQYDGNVVAGHFEFIDPEINQTSVISSIRFIPDDMQKYSGFEILECWDVILTINKTTPVFVDENDTLPVATEVEPGAKLSTSILSGALIMNPYYPEEPKALAAVWKWSKGSTIVNESGYYEARISATNYERISALVYVKVKGNAESTEIIETPTLKSLELGKQWKDVTFEGGKAVVKGETEEVAGTYSITKINSYVGGLNFDIGVGEYIIEVTFTPDDREKYLISTTTLTVTVNKLPIRFVDADGNDIIPEITIKSAAVFGSSNIISAYLYNYLNATKITNWQYFDMDGNSLDGTAVPIGKHQYQVKVTSKDTNYEPTMLTFFLTLEPTYFNVTTRYDYVKDYLTVVPDNKSISDEFDVWVDGELIGTTTGQKIKWATDESRDYNVTLVHKDTTEGVYALANTEYTMTVKIPRQIFRSDSGLKFTTTGGSYPGNDNYAYKGDVLTLTCTDETFYNWQLSIGGEDWIPEGLTAEDLKKPTITFTMPDCDIFACPNDESRFAAAADCDHLCHSENPIYQFFWKILHFFFRLLNIQQYCDCGMLHYESAIFG